MQNGFSVWITFVVCVAVLTAGYAAWNWRRRVELRRIGTSQPGTVTRLTRGSVVSGKSIRTVWYVEAATTDLVGQARSVKSEALYYDPEIEYPPGSNVNVVFHPSNPNRYLVHIDHAQLDYRRKA